MKYSFTCLIPGCGHTINVAAASDVHAVDAILANGASHRAEAHPDITADERLIREAIRGQMKKS